MKKLGLIIIVIAVLAAAWYLLSPIFIQQTVEEELPINTSPISTDVGVVVEEEPASASPDTTAIDLEDMPKDIILDQDIVMDEPVMEMVSSDPVIETRGSFEGADNFHKGSGELVVIRDEDSQFIRFENFSVTNGPDLFVTLNKGDDPKGEHVIVAALKGNKGSQNYDISEYDLSEYQSVSIYCRAFTTEFATAQL